MPPEPPVPLQMVKPSWCPFDEPCTPQCPRMLDRQCDGLVPKTEHPPSTCRLCDGTGIMPGWREEPPAAPHTCADCGDECDASTSQDCWRNGFPRWRPPESAPVLTDDEKVRVGDLFLRGGISTHDAIQKVIDERPAPAKRKRLDVVCCICGQPWVDGHTCSAPPPLYARPEHRPPPAFTYNTMGIPVDGQGRRAGGVLRSNSAPEEHPAWTIEDLDREITGAYHVIEGLEQRIVKLEKDVEHFCKLLQEDEAILAALQKRME